MESSKLITDFVNNIASGDLESAKAAFSAYCNAKANNMGKQEKINEGLAFYREQLTERMQNNDFRLEGEKVVINGKVVGRIKIDMNDFESGVDFISADGNFSKSFDTADDLFKFLSQKFLGDSNVN